MNDQGPRYGWQSDLSSFRATRASLIREKLCQYIVNPSPQQVRAWDESIPPLQREATEIINWDGEAKHYSAILEYELPMEARRPDVILLANGAVVVLECKSKAHPTQADIDQASAYARDLRCYHRCCHNRTVVPVVVPFGMKGYQGQDNHVHIAGPDSIDQLIAQLESKTPSDIISPEEFLAEEAYLPMPTLVQAARELFHNGTVRPIHRARAATDPAVDEISRIIHEASAIGSRRLILLTGVPGAGKTLVGLRTVHAHFLDDLVVDRPGQESTVPAVFLTGNGPLCEVLQYELKGAGGGGKTFVRGVKDYVRRYSSKPGLVPPEHVLIFDEAQRAFDAEEVKARHQHMAGGGDGKSEPEHFIEFAERIPEWCVVIGLIGSGQEIHVGEEGGLVQWRHAIDRCSQSSNWEVHGPPGIKDLFADATYSYHSDDALNLDREIRFHMASDLHQLVGQILDGHAVEENKLLALRLEEEGFHLRITRDLSIAKTYLKDRYAEYPLARYGIVSSAKDKDLERFDVPNGFQSTKRVKMGPWYSDAEDAPGGYSCRHLKDCVTEFGAQGLELDAALLAWGTDLVRINGQWSNHKARGYKNKNRIKNPMQLRQNAYRVLMTRGRDAIVVFLPPLEELDETSHYLRDSGFKVL